MRLTDASVAIRPRSAWEALDLGILLAHRHARLLMGSWALLTLPLFAVLSLLLWQHPTLAILIFWWLKPAFERLPLYILSHALFGDTPTLRQALRAYPALLRKQLPASLLWRRFSPTRSFDLPVLQLEGLAGEPRSQRLIVLSQRNAGGATWLTVVGVHLEMALWAGFAMLLYLLIPAQNEIDWNWQSLLDPEAGEWLWLEHLSNLLYVLVLVVWEPIYVACGFTLYLNRRTELEAWDIELVFRRLRQRLVGSAYVLLLGLAASLAWLPAPSAYAEPAAATSAGEAELPPEQARLLRQKLNSEQAGKQIRAIVDGAPFKNSETVTGWRFGDKTEKKDSRKEDEERLKAFFEALANWVPFRHAAQVIEALLWALLFSAVFLLVWRYREWLRLFVGNLGLPQRARREAPTVMFGLDLSPESLPDDIAGNAERLWNEKPREALGLLYRGLLSRLLHDYRLPLKGSHTEGEVLRLVEGLEQQRPLLHYSQLLTAQWQALAYGHRLPADDARLRLCDGWRSLFAAGAKP
ncbi:TPA: DUF4129 domain-containing protein [Pseudomonas aeruginosa]|nr:DUF4129 domain-containing protein [Pseudomonas aeruginosa]MBV6162223.1 DUF4129 domain-containing protein [Pseudomonas aeruginosa]MBV6193201.1 DUF4129 domain-containing protein [Pseudomonas aeruginosa]